MVLGVLLALGSWAAPRVVRTVSPQAAVDGAWRRDFDSAQLVDMLGGNRWANGPRDPWGRVWRERTFNDEREVRILKLARDAQAFRGASFFGSYSASVPYSMGPDGVDQGGDGDDLYPRTKVSPLVWLPAGYARELLSALALVSLWWAAWLRRFRGTLVDDVLGVAILTAVPAGLAGYAVYWALENRSTRDLVPASPLALLPTPLVAVGSVAFVVAILALALRLATTTESSASDEGEPARAPRAADLQSL